MHTVTKRKGDVMPLPWPLPEGFVRSSRTTQMALNSIRKRAQALFGGGGGIMPRDDRTPDTSPPIHLSTPQGVRTPASVERVSCPSCGGEVALVTGLASHHPRNCGEVILCPSTRCNFRGEIRLFRRAHSTNERLRLPEGRDFATSPASRGDISQLRRVDTARGRRSRNVARVR